MIIHPWTEELASAPEKHENQLARKIRGDVYFYFRYNMLCLYLVVYYKILIGSIETLIKPKIR
ncbi:MAG: hypothetical protein COT25_03710 [Candidatus Kerfeldbacteria bacterium CG08_land_8_20_14_0_20_42_7]|uniref:Uncharacterized protein n=1 Tax=Candidatus Kerfeldbacteria bacterium CG08_land_8_20_14_0_20_42_7 TaxID=2014245 RepID=A0A2H0YSA2_9BACT|nr:MAG: hypothetical protein COT25_03710 [Candidatus Kerfeldbacteria bacterium CG08_land_8_20_14_0_20_42_7]